jgi:hypothetical protein
MKALVRAACSSRGQQPFRVLEVGSWAGESAILWSTAIKEFNGGQGLVICLDSWEPYGLTGKAKRYGRMNERLFERVGFLGCSYTIFEHLIRMI